MQYDLNCFHKKILVLVVFETALFRTKRSPLKEVQQITNFAKSFFKNKNRTQTEEFHTPHIGTNVKKIKPKSYKTINKTVGLTFLLLIIYKHDRSTASWENQTTQICSN